jgi:VWFA-related protein
MQIKVCRRSEPGALSSMLLLAVILLFNGAANCRGQTEAAETIRVDSDLVDLQVSVIRHDPSKPAVSLQQSDFRVFEDGAPQDVAFFEASDAPFDLMLLIDLSGSTADKLKLIRRSSKRFVETARPLDRIAILTFTDTIEVVSPLTSDRGKLRRAIDDIEKPTGGTNFWDALAYVLEAVTRRDHVSRRSAVVVMTDGVDNALPDVFGEGSHTPFEALLNLVKRSTTIVYPIYLDTEPEELKLHRTPKSAYVTARSQLAQLADASGTQVYRANKIKDLESVYEQVIRDLGTVYSIGYRPNNSLRDGKWHEVSIQLVNHPELTARTKSGYYAKSLVTNTPP